MKVLKIAKAFLKWTAIVLFGLIALLFLFVEGFDRYLATENGARWYYRNVPTSQLSIHTTSSGVRFLELGDTTRTPLLLIHGAPGSILDWRSLAMQEALYETYYLIIPERPGYGGTRPRKAEPSIEVQAKRMAEILTEYNLKEAVVAGHSYGGPIAVIMGAIVPERIAHIYGLSGQYDPDNEIIFGISHLIKFRIFKYLLPRMIWVSNVEKLSHQKAQQEILPYYPKVQVPVTLVHGDADSLVPYENSIFVREKLAGIQASLITLAGKDHPIHMQMPQDIARLLLDESNH
jgi:pimeloyl-ACP methyl ester carboxylesterase